MMEPEIHTQEVERLQRELAHVNDQCRTAHAMAMDWRRRCLDAEARCQRLEHKYRNLRPKRVTADSVG